MSRREQRVLQTVKSYYVMLMVAPTEWATPKVNPVSTLDFG